MSPTLSISMMVAGLVLLGAAVLAALVLACLAVVLVRESRKLDGAADLVKKYAANAAETARLEKGLNGLEEVVATKLNRIATTSKREKKAKESRIEDNGFPVGLDFPSRGSGGLEEGEFEN